MQISANVLKRLCRLNLYKALELGLKQTRTSPETKISVSFDHVPRLNTYLASSEVRLDHVPFYRQKSPKWFYRRLWV